MSIANPSDPFVLCAGTIGTFDLLERIDAASAAGYTGLGLRPEDYTKTLERGVADRELKMRLADAGLRVVELQSVHGWAGDADDQARGGRIEAGCYRVADALGADYLMVSNTTLHCSWAEAVDRFGRIADRAASHGLDIAIEFLPWGPVPDARTAWQLIQECGRDNTGVLVDTWHHFRGAADDEMILAIPAGRIRAVQIDDAAQEVQGTHYDDTRNRRLNPGEGDFDLVEFVRLLDAHGVHAPYAVEVLSHAMRAMDPREAARLSADATRRVVAAARALDSALRPYL